ncbi:hypothetical protein Trydic_g1337 [Trypoxylus dichotomus]
MEFMYYPSKLAYIQCHRFVFTATTVRGCGVLDEMILLTVVVRFEVNENFHANARICIGQYPKWEKRTSSLATDREIWKWIPLSSV